MGIGSPVPDCPGYMILSEVVSSLFPQSRSYSLLTCCRRTNQFILSRPRIDSNIQVQIEMPQGFKHICEIQIHHKQINKLNSELESHHYYEYFRSYFSGATTSLKERLDDLTMIGRGGELDDYLLHQLLERNEDEGRLERLGVLFEFSLCEYYWALGVYGRLFELRMQMHGPSHPLVAKTYIKLANVLQKQGKLDESMELYKASHAINTRTHGEEHLSVASIYDSMAMVLMEQDKLDEAIILFNKALVVNMRSLGADHSSVANTYNNIAVVHQKWGNLEKAMGLYEKALEINKKCFGERHFSVAATYNNIALILMTQCKFDASMVLYEKSLEIYNKTLGEGHSDVAKAYYNMALVHKAQGNLNEAMELYERSLEIDKKNLGEKHSSVAHTYQSMALILQDQGKQDEAMALYDKALAIKRRVSFERCFAFNMRKERADTSKQARV
jgi:tetratricopeptide (TPR) repeat protein